MDQEVAGTTSFWNPNKNTKAPMAYETNFAFVESRKGLKSQAGCKECWANVD